MKEYKGMVIFVAETENEQKRIRLEERLQDHAEDIVLTRKIKDKSGFIEYKSLNIVYDLIQC